MKRKFFYWVSGILVLSLLSLGCAGIEEEEELVYHYDFGNIDIIKNSGVQLRIANLEDNDEISGFVDVEIQVTPSSKYQADVFSYLYLIVDDTLIFDSAPRKLILNISEPTVNLELSSYKLRNGLHKITPWLRVKKDDGVAFIVGESVYCDINNVFEVITNVIDPEGDWHGISNDLFMPHGGGPDGTYLDGLHDITNMEVAVSGPNLKLSFSMVNLSTAWNPHNGFDHVSFHIFLNDPSTVGKTVMPRQRGNVPEEMGDWNYLVVADGWTKGVYSWEEATTTSFGIATGSPEITIDGDNYIISFYVFADALGNPDTLSGWKIYVSNFDMDGTTGIMRPVVYDGSGHVIRSTNADLFSEFGLYQNPLIMDWIEPVLITY